MTRGITGRVGGQRAHGWVVLIVVAPPLLFGACERRSDSSLAPAATPGSSSASSATSRDVTPTSSSAGVATAKQIEALSIARQLFPESEFAPSNTVQVDEATGEYRVTITRMVIDSIVASRPDLSGIGPAELKAQQAQLDAASKNWLLFVHLRAEAGHWLLLGTSCQDETGALHGEMNEKPVRLWLEPRR